MLSGRKVLLLGIALVLAVAVSIWLVRDRSAKHPLPTSKSVPAAPTPGDTMSAGPASADKSGHLQYAMDLAREGGPAAQEKLAQAYGEWAAEPNTVDARAVALGALLNEPQLPKKVSLVLNAVNASKVPPDQDPLWHRLAESVATLFSGDNFDKGRDLLMMEQRQAPRRLLLDSFLELGSADRLGQLTLTQRNNLLNDLIDLYHSRQTEPEIKPHIVDTVRALGGDDVATVLGGADVRKGSKHPAIVEYERQLTEAERLLLPNSARSTH